MALHFSISSNDEQGDRRMVKLVQDMVLPSSLPQGWTSFFDEKNSSWCVSSSDMPDNTGPGTCICSKLMYTLQCKLLLGLSMTKKILVLFHLNPSGRTFRLPHHQPTSTPWSNTTGARPSWTWEVTRRCSGPSRPTHPHRNW